MIRKSFFICLFILLTSSLSFAQQFTLVLDAGHGGHDPGTKVGELLEKDIVFEVAQHAQKMNDNKNLKIVLTRTDDNFIELQKRVEMINEIQPDLVLSLHVDNDPTNKDMKGFKIFISPKSESHQKSKVYAEELSKFLQPYGNAKILEGKFKVIAESKTPALLIELGNAAISANEKMLASEESKMELAKVILSYIYTFIPN